MILINFWWNNLIKIERILGKVTLSLNNFVRLSQLGLTITANPTVKYRLLAVYTKRSPRFTLCKKRNIKKTKTLYALFDIRIHENYVCTYRHNDAFVMSLENGNHFTDSNSGGKTFMYTQEKTETHTKNKAWTWNELLWKEEEDRKMNTFKTHHICKSFLYDQENFLNGFSVKRE